MKTSDGVIMAYVNEFGGLGGYREYSSTMNFYVRQRLCYKLTIKTLRERLFCSLRVFCCNKILITFIFYQILFYIIVICNCLQNCVFCCKIILYDFGINAKRKNQNAKKTNDR